MLASTFASTVKGSLLLIALHSLMRGFRVRTGGRITSPSLPSSTYSVNECQRVHSLFGVTSVGIGQSVFSNAGLRRAVTRPPPSIR
jgi:hypothetical protein